MADVIDCMEESIVLIKRVQMPMERTALKSCRRQRTLLAKIKTKWDEWEGEEQESDKWEECRTDSTLRWKL